MGCQQAVQEVCVQYGKLFEVLKKRMAGGGLPGSGSWTGVHQPRVRTLL